MSNLINSQIVSEILNQTNVFVTFKDLKGSELVTLSTNEDSFFIRGKKVDQIRFEKLLSECQPFSYEATNCNDDFHYHLMMLKKYGYNEFWDKFYND